MEQEASGRDSQGPAQRSENTPVYIVGVSKAAANVLAKAIANELAKVLIEPAKETPSAPEPAAAAAAQSGNAPRLSASDLDKIADRVAAKLSAGTGSQQVQPNTNNQKNKPWYKRGFENL